MVMTSQQIGQMASGQAAMFGQFQSYAQQITPPYSNRPGMGYMAGPAPSPPPMPGWNQAMPGYGGGIPQMIGQFQYAQPGSGYGQMMGEQMMGGGLRTASTGLGAASAFMGIAPLIGMGAGALGVGGAGMAGLAALGGPIGVPIAAGIAAAGYGVNQMATGFQQRQGVNQVLRSRFGGAMGIGSGRGGRGFSTEEMGGISTMLREMGTEDLFSNMEELTRVMDRTAQMGVYRGVSSAREFKTKFKQTVDALKEIAQTMNTTLEGASEFMTQSRQMGFFSGQDISRNLLQTRLGAASTGMSVGQMQQIGQMGSQMGMSMGWRGRTGAGAAQNIATNIGTAVRTGALSEEQLFEATGGLQGAEGVQALTSRMMQVNNRFLSRGAGRVLTAAMWDPETGGINQEVMERIQRGEISFQEARSMGRRNIAQTGGRMSEFFSQEERIRGQAMEAGGFDMTMGMIESHFRRRGGRASGEDLDLDSPGVQRFLRRRMGMSQSEVEAFTQMRREMPRIMSERRGAMRQEISNMAQSRRREGQGLEGVRRRWAQWWERSVENPIRQAADDMTTTISRGIEDMMNDFEGRIQTSISEQTRSQVQQWARTGERPAGFMGGAEYRQFSQEAMSRGATSEIGEGFMAGLGRAVGARGPGMVQQLRSAQAYKHGLPANASSQERQEFLQRMQRDLSVTASELGVGSAEMKSLGSQALDMVYGSMSAAQREEWINNRGNKEKSLSMARDRIRMLKKKEEFQKYFAKAKNWYQGYALLTELEQAAGLGVLGVDAAALPGGGGGGFRMGLLGAREMQQEALDKIVSLSGTAEGRERATAGWGEKATRGVFGALSLGQTEVSAALQRGVLGKDIFQWAFGRDSVEGAALDSGAARRLLKNTELQQDIRLARKGDKGARQRLTKASLAIEEGGDAAVATGYGEAARDRRDLRTLLDMVTKGTAQQHEAIDQFLIGVSGEQRMIIEQNVKASAAKLSRFTSTHRQALQEGMGEEAFAQYQKIIERQEAGDLEGARDAEKAFYQQYGGTKEGNFLLSHLRKGGVGAGMQEGLATMADYTRFFRTGSGRQKAKTLIEMTLGQAGIRGQRELRQLLGGSFMNKVLAGKGTPEELAQQLVGRLSEEQLAGLSERGISQEDFVRKLSERIKIGKGGVDMSEIQKMLTGSAVENAWGVRLDEAPKEEVDSATQSLKELRTMNQYMKALVQGDERALAQLRAIEQAAANSDGGGDTERPAGNAPKKGGPS